MDWKSRKDFKGLFVHPIKRRLAKYYVLFLQKYLGLKIIGITGSAGKTTTKEMLSSILKLKGKTQYSYANIDPVYNIPTTIFKTSPFAKFLILEMGIEFKGEMDFYTWMAKPDVSVITNIFPTHIEFFENEEGVFSEKKRLVTNLSENGTAVLNDKDKFLKKIKFSKTIWINKDIKAEKIKVSLENTNFVLSIKAKTAEVNIPISGRQFVENALSAAAAAYACGCSIKQIKEGLENFSSAEHRMKVIKHKSGAIILDDSYNNNPKAAQSALKTFKEIAGNRKTVLIFGDMLELGKDEIKYHEQISDEIRENKIDKVLFVGKLSKYAHNKLQKNYKSRTKWVSNSKRASELLKDYLKPENTILIKASRSIGLDKLVADII